jgi:anti-anti-sigma factor
MARPPQLTTVEWIDGQGVIVVKVAGELDIAVADALERRLRGFLGRPRRRIRVDLSEVGFIDARGLHAVINAISAARRGGGVLEVAPNASRAVRRLIDLVGAAEEIWPREWRWGPDRGRLRSVRSAPAAGLARRYESAEGQAVGARLSRVSQRR